MTYWEETQVKNMFGKDCPFDYVENSPKQEFNFSDEDIALILLENAKLIEDNNRLRKNIADLKRILNSTRFRKHSTYKSEMERLRRKLTRIYKDAHEKFGAGMVDYLKKL